MPRAHESMPFAAKLRDGRFVLTAEVTPPLSCRREDLIARALPLKDAADAVNVTDGAGAHVHMDAMTAAAILHENGIEPILQLVCRDRNRLALQSALLGAATFGIRNLLLLRGDNPNVGDQPEAKGVFDLDSRGLIATAVMMRDQGVLPSGRKIAGEPDFFVGAADTPIDPPAGWSPKALSDKIAAGAQFVQTQFCMDATIVRRYRERMSEQGVASDFPIVIGVALLRSARSAVWIRNHLPGAIIPDEAVARLRNAADPVEEGRRICLATIQQLSEIAGIAGAHVMAPGHDSEVGPFLAQARRAIRLRTAR